MAMTSECQRQKQGNRSIDNYYYDQERKVKMGPMSRLPSSSASGGASLRLLLLARPAQLLLLLLLYITPVPSNQVPHEEQPRRQLLPAQQQQQLRQLRQQQQQLRSSATDLQLLEDEQITPLPLSLSPNGQQQQQQHPDAPKLIPLSALDRYQEGADLRLFCSASAPQSGGRLQFEWRKNQVEQLGAGPTDGDTEPHRLEPLPAKGLRHLQQQQQQQQQQQRLSVSLMDDSSSVLRINHLEAEDSGNYTCLARNQQGFDSSTVRVNVNVRLKWVREPPGEIQVRAGKSVQLECEASGQPAPLISWTSLRDHQTIHGKVMRIDRAMVNDSGLYECRAVAPPTAGGSHYESSLHHALAKGEQLRKVVKLIVNGK